MDTGNLLSVHPGIGHSHKKAVISPENIALPGAPCIDISPAQQQRIRIKGISPVWQTQKKKTVAFRHVRRMDNYVIGNIFHIAILVSWCQLNILDHTVVRIIRIHFTIDLTSYLHIGTCISKNPAFHIGFRPHDIYPDNPGLQGVANYQKNK